MNRIGAQPNKAPALTDNERVVCKLHQVAELKDSTEFAAWVSEDGSFWDVSADGKYFAPNIGETVDICATAFPDMHRALERQYVIGDVVIVQLSLSGTHEGPLAMAQGTIPATGKKMHTPGCDVFQLMDGKVKSFHCFTVATIQFGQLGVLGNLGAAFHAPTY